MLIRFAALLMTALLTRALASAAEHLPLPDPGSLDSLGVNIHFTDARAGELEQLAAGGYRLVRMDFGWEGIEPQKGVYDFSAYDRLLTSLDKQGVRAYFILDYHNRFYDQGESPRSDAGRDGFCAFVAAAMHRFAGRGIVWEMYNEPNISFWKPTPNVDDYAKLCLAVGKTIRSVSPHELFVGPATSEIDLRFLERCFAAGCLNYWDAVSVHPYRHRPPETAAADYRILRDLISRYAPPGPDGRPIAIPLISGEWGYSSGGWGAGYDEGMQGRYLPREYLTNLANAIRVSIWYDWHEDGTDAHEGEHHFGSVRYSYQDGHPEVYEPKPAYLAASTLSTQLHELTFSKALALGPDEHVLLFSSASAQRMVAWTSASTDHIVTVPASPGRFRAVGHLGTTLPAREADKNGLRLTLTQEPVYLAAEEPNESLRLAAAWQCLPLDLPVVAPGQAVATATFTNPLTRMVTVSFGDAATEVTAGASATGRITVTIGERQSSVQHLTLVIDGSPVWTQSTHVVVRNPIEATLGPILSQASTGQQELDVRIENPAGAAFTGTLALTTITGFSPRDATTPVVLTAGQRDLLLRIPVSGASTTDYETGMLLRDQTGASWRTGSVHRCHRLAEFASGPGTEPMAWKVVGDGDAKVPATWMVSSESVTPSGGVPCNALAISYHFDPGWRFLRVIGGPADALPGKPSAIGMWVRSDGSGNLICLRLNDATGQTFQCSGGRLVDTGWQYRTFPIESSSGNSWGGAKDGVIHYPLHLDTLFLIDHAIQPQPSTGSVAIAAPTLIE
jgi:hypothetical protein